MLTGIVMALASVGLPWTVFGVFGCGGDLTNAAIVAGIFSVANTYLNIRMLRQVEVVKTQVGAVKDSARAGTQALHDLATDRKSDRAEDAARRKRRHRKDDD